MNNNNELNEIKKTLKQLGDNYNNIEEKYNKSKKQLGITLVALVITIIVLLILAGITVAQLTGSGLFDNVKLAKQKYKDSQDLEENILSGYENGLNNYMGLTRDGVNYQILWDSRKEGETALSTVNDYRTLANVSSYDFLLVYTEAKNYPEEHYVPQVVHRSDYDFDIRYEIGHFSSTVANNWGAFKIDTQNNRIVFTENNSGYHAIRKVIGIK